MRLKFTQQEALWAYIFVLPALLGFVCLAAFPIFFGFWISLTEWDAFTKPAYIGLANYRRLFSLREPLWYGKTISNTLFFVAMMPVGIAIQLFLALLVNVKLTLSRLFRSVFFLPSVTSAAVVAMVWFWMYDTNFGLINWLLSIVGIPAIPWLESARWSKPALWIMMTWQGAGYGMMINLAALQGIPEELIEAAMIDGAGRWRRFFNVTLPLLTPALFFQFVTGAIGAFQVFGQVWMTTRGGPSNSTATMVLYIYNYAFAHGAWGFASSGAYVLALMILVLTLIQFIFQRRWVFYGV
ncbi:MAG: sugar ABC transporter permease [Chloroflexi bacterium]|jgi:multiple sugar transport system permease protein|nr:sugar ABC transporter permease [Chloroflexota bacterium]